MKTLIIQFDTRPQPTLGLLPRLLARNSGYAARHGYEHHFLDHAPFDLPVYWQKPAMCRHALNAGYDLVAWLDTDAVVHDVGRRLEDLFTGPEVMVAAGDNPLWRSPFNAGVFAVRGAGGAALMERWMGLFAGTGWTRTETAWICRDEWAGSSFEQGAFVDHLLADATASGELRLADWRLLQSPFPLAESFTLHFPGPFKANVAPYLQVA